MAAHVGALRSLTDVFLLMRNNAVQTRHIYAEQNLSDGVRLLRDEGRRGRGSDVEAGLLGAGGQGNQVSSAPPPWTDSLEEVQYIITRLRSKLAELLELQSQALHRPSLDDSSRQDERAAALAAELQKHFSTAHRLVQSIRDHSQHGTIMEQRLASNVLSMVVGTLQTLGQQLRAAQGEYLRVVTSREEREQAFFRLQGGGADVIGESSSGPSAAQKQANKTALDDLFQENEEDIDEVFQSGGSMRLMAATRDSTRLALQREREVSSVMRSICELGNVFRDVAHLVQEQGTVLDRIDYNLERTHGQVESACRQLQRAERYQKSSRKMNCICCLGCSITVMLLLIIIFKIL